MWSQQHCKPCLWKDEHKQISSENKRKHLYSKKWNCSLIQWFPSNPYNASIKRLCSPPCCCTPWMSKHGQNILENLLTPFSEQSVTFTLIKEGMTTLGLYTSGQGWHVKMFYSLVFIFISLLKTPTCTEYPNGKTGLNFFLKHKHTPS